MRPSSHRRFSRIGATTIAVGVAAFSAGLASTAQAAPSPSTSSTLPAYTADASASLIRLTALESQLLGLDGASLADLRVANAQASFSSTKNPQSKAHAAPLDASLLNIKLPTNLLTGEATQIAAGADNAQPSVVQGPKLNVLGLVSLGTGQQRAHARWNAQTARPTGPTQLAESATSLANLTVLPGTGLPIAVPFIGAAVLDAPSVAYSQATTNVVNVAGQSGLGVASSARTSLTQLTLFRGTAQQLTIKVISPPKLDVVAAGTAKSSVKYTAPLVEIVDAQGKATRIDTPQGKIEIGLNGVKVDLPGVEETPDGQTLTVVPEAQNVAATGTAPKTAPKKSAALLRVTLGDIVDQQISPTSVNAEASTLRVEVLDIPGVTKLLDLSIGDLRASATVPNGGIQPPSSPSASPSAKPSAAASDDGAGNAGTDDGETLPVTGSSIPLFLGAGIALVVLGRFAMVIARRVR